MGSVKLLIELFLVGILAPIALQAVAAGNFSTGIYDTAGVLVTIWTVVIPILCGIAIAVHWLGKV